MNEPYTTNPEGNEYTLPEMYDVVTHYDGELWVVVSIADHLAEKYREVGVVKVGADVSDTFLLNWPECEHKMQRKVGGDATHNIMRCMDPKCGDEWTEARD